MLHRVRTGRETAVTALVLYLLLIVRGINHLLDAWFANGPRMHTVRVDGLLSGLIDILLAALLFSLMRAYRG